MIRDRFLYITINVVNIKYILLTFRLFGKISRNEKNLNTHSTPSRKLKENYQYFAPRYTYLKRNSGQYQLLNYRLAQEWHLNKPSIGVNSHFLYPQSSNVDSF